MEKIAINKCIRCWKNHIFSIPKKWITNWFEIKLLCPNEEYIMRMENFSFNAEANILKSWDVNLDKNLIARYWNDNLKLKKEKITNIWSYVLSSNEYNIYLRDIYNTYIMGYTYPFIISLTTLLERVLNIMILKLKKYHINTEDYNKIQKYINDNKDRNNSEWITNWPIILKALKNWWYLTSKQKKILNKFYFYRNEVVHFNLNYNFKEKENKILYDFTFIINSIFWIYERKDIIDFSLRWMFCIKKEMMEDTFVKEFFKPNWFFISKKSEKESEVNFNNWNLYWFNILYKII